MSPKKKKTDYIRILLEPELKDRLLVHCEKLDIPYSQFVRNAIKEKLSKEEN